MIDNNDDYLFFTFSNAAAIQTAIEVLLNQFNNQYLGSHPDDASASSAVGGSPQEGALYWNSAAKELRVFNDMAWEPVATSIIANGGVAQSAVLLASGATAETLAEAEATSYAAEVREIQLLGRDAYGDGGGFGAIEIANGTPTAGQFQTNVNNRRWENAENIVTPAMFANIEEMLTFSKAQMRIPIGNYEFGDHIAVSPQSVIRCEEGATFRPTFIPNAANRRVPLIDLGNGADVNYIKLALDAGIKGIATGVRVGNKCRIGYYEATSVDWNNNRQGAADRDVGTLQINGAGIRIGQLLIDRFDRGIGIVGANDVVIGYAKILETVMGVQVNQTRNLHILSAYTTGPEDPTEPNPYGKGIMTPGGNALTLAGCSDSSFSNWTAVRTLEHAWRVGGVAGGTTVPNHRLMFSNFQCYGPYGSGFKMDDGDAFNIKRVTVNGLATYDVGNGNWFGTPGYSNWSQGGVDQPGNNNDGNKVACAIRNSQNVLISGVYNGTNDHSHSGNIGFWVERCAAVKATGIFTEKARAHGCVVQSGTGTSANHISVHDVTSVNNDGDGVRLNPVGDGVTWRNVQVTGINSQNNGGYGVNVLDRADGLQPYATFNSRIEGYVAGNALGNRNIAPATAAASRFIDETKEEIRFTPTFGFATNGDLSVAYVAQNGVLRRQGRWVDVEIELVFAPTFSTASGNIRVGGLLYPAASSINNIDAVITDANLTWNSRAQLVPSARQGQTYIEIRGLGPGLTTSPLQVNAVTSGVQMTIAMSGRYRI